MKGFGGRPTTDFGRESLFNLLSTRMELDGAAVLDLFAGTGMVSFEFLSRGAASVTAVELAPKACRYMANQAQALGTDDLHPVCANAWAYLERPLTQFDVVFADPPYDLPHLADLPVRVRDSGMVVPGGWFILEHGERTCVDHHPGFVLHRNYGHVHFSLFTFE
jgi:16S rRNA (guanine(966)-N(2))-methyltransferase RsmD